MSKGTTWFKRLRDKREAQINLAALGGYTRGQENPEYKDRRDGVAIRFSQKRAIAPVYSFDGAMVKAKTVKPRQRRRTYGGNGARSEMRGSGVAVGCWSAETEAFLMVRA